MAEPTDEEHRVAGGIYRLARESADYNRDEAVFVIAGILADRRAKARAPFLALAEDWTRLRPKDPAKYPTAATINACGDILRATAQGEQTTAQDLPT